MSRIEAYRLAVNSALEQCFTSEPGYPIAGLADAMRYSLLAGGKRIRPILVLEFCRLSGGNPEEAIPVACAIEMLHTYSLIHDDLPSMDNDDLRRGRPTNHKVFGECTATLAGDCLQAEAFGTILRSDLPAERRAACASALADAVGMDGMCGGQYLDMLAEGTELTAEQLDDLNARKTGALLIAACRMGVHAAGGNRQQLEAAASFGAALGAAFQIRDDILDVISTADELGKPIGSDAREQKNTYMALFGQEKCEAMVEKLSAAAKQALCEGFTGTDELCALTDQLTTRRN